MKSYKTKQAFFLFLRMAGDVGDATIETGNFAIYLDGSRDQEGELRGKKMFRHFQVDSSTHIRIAKEAPKYRKWLDEFRQQQASA